MITIAGRPLLAGERPGGSRKPQRSTRGAAHNLSHLTPSVVVCPYRVAGSQSICYGATKLPSDEVGDDTLSAIARSLSGSGAAAGRPGWDEGVRTARSPPRPLQDELPMRCAGCRAGQSVSDTGEEGLVALGASSGDAGSHFVRHGLIIPCFKIRLSLPIFSQPRVPHFRAGTETPPGGPSASHDQRERRGGRARLAGHHKHDPIGQLAGSRRLHQVSTQTRSGNCLADMQRAVGSYVTSECNTSPCSTRLPRRRVRAVQSPRGGGHRRTRAFIRMAYPEATIGGRKVHFPERRLRTIRYDLDSTYAGIYDEIVSGVESLKLAPYNLKPTRRKRSRLTSSISVLGTRAPDARQGFGILEERNVKRAYAIFNNFYQNRGIITLLRWPRSFVAKSNSARFVMQKKCVLVTAGASGIGLAIASAFAGLSRTDYQSEAE
jgi:hypothetical protein